jgi:hypothetical protein
MEPALALELDGPAFAAAVAPLTGVLAASAVAANPEILRKSRLLWSGNVGSFGWMLVVEYYLKT